MFVLTVAVLDVHSAWVTTKYHASIYNLKVCFVANFICYNIAKYFKDGSITHITIPKIKRVPVF